MMNARPALSAPAMLGALFAIGVTAAAAEAHPVAKNAHDRTIVVRLQKGNAPRQVRVRVEYRLEVAEATVLLNDMRDYKSEANHEDYFPQRVLEYYAQFTRIYAPIYGANLSASVNRKTIPRFDCIRRNERLRDDDGMSLGHLRCDFVFESTFEMPPGDKAIFHFREQSYYLEDGQIVLSLVNESGFPIESKTVPDEAVLKRSAENQLQRGDDDRLREITAVFAPIDTGSPPNTTADPPAPNASKRKAGHDDRFSLLPLILHNEYGFLLTMLLAFVFGAAHALTPGHGKTLVAAYLVGERGTVWHAVYLGLVTTLTHTGVVMLLAVILTFLPNDMQRTFQAWIQNGLGLVMGLIVTGMGFWLLLQRLAGRADHIHLDGGDHHHHGHHHHHPQAGTNAVGWWGLTLLGITGGLIPCWDAVGVLTLTVGSNQLWLVLPAVLVFSAGLAIVLVAIGILVVQVPRFAESRFGNERLLRALPIVSAILVTMMGLWLCYEAAHGGG
ncbi:MAG: hypothetical protein HYX68_15725 [Planctomycetes bacterium]|nr:hypothetical protein [Planctomycetota bacterium]